MRFVILVMDSVGIGALPDADRFGDEGADTLGNIYKARGLKIPNMLALGIGNIQHVAIPEKVERPAGCYGKCAERFAGKDTTGGHWEIAGLLLDKPFPTYPRGFPKHIMDEFTRLTGLEALGNIPASGTEIIQRLGDEHMRTGKPIVYTSADSVFQIAAHEKVISLDKLYDICEKARSMLHGDDLVGRVIARPFEGESGSYVRTRNRKDYSVQPPEDTLLDAVKAAGMQVAAVGKIEDIFAHRGITISNHTTSNDDGVQATLQYLQQDFDGLLFTNLVDFDMLYGHRNNVEGYAQALERLDSQLPDILAALKPDDILAITADHGCDPTMSGSTDHSREYIPLLVYGQGVKAGVDLGIRDSFADIAATAGQYLGLGEWKTGRSFLDDILR